MVTKLRPILLEVDLLKIIDIEVKISNERNQATEQQLTTPKVKNLPENFSCYQRATTQKTCESLKNIENVFRSDKQFTAKNNTTQRSRVVHQATKREPDSR